VAVSVPQPRDVPRRVSAEEANNLLDAILRAPPGPVRWDGELRPCRRCKVPTGWRTARGSAVHHDCADPLAPLRRASQEQWLDALYEIARVLGPTRPVRVGSEAPPTPHPDRLPLREGPCGWCGAPGLLLTADRYYHCRTHLFPPYRWPEPRQGGTP